jgi:hypothetical protein
MSILIYLMVSLIFLKYFHGAPATKQFLLDRAERLA